MIDKKIKDNLRAALEMLLDKDYLPLAFVCHGPDGDIRMVYGTQDEKEIGELKLDLLELLDPGKQEVSIKLTTPKVQ